ncbi:MAG: glycosyltransferase family 4 protein [Thermoproteota archaeon]|nr:glycosyltransferase family 4 protein [Thermoproteota archaeon]
MAGKRLVVASLDSVGCYCPVSIGTCDPCDLVNRYSCVREEAQSATEKFACFPYASMYPLLTLLSRQVHKYIAVSEFIKQEYVKYGFRPSKIIVVPNSTHISSWQFAITKPHKGINTIYVGRMVWSKSVDVLIKAFQKVSNKYPYVSLMLIGEGSELGSYRSLVKELNIETKVIFTGYVKQEDLKYYYSIADLFVYPSMFETFGISLFEPMVYNVPALVSNHGAVKEVVKDAGVTFRMGQVQDLAEKMDMLIGDPYKLLKLKERCKDVICQYADDEVLEAFIKVYDDLLCNQKSVLV